MFVRQPTRFIREFAEALRCREIGDVHDQRVEARPALGLVDSGDGSGIGRVRRKPVDGLGRHSDRVAGEDQPRVTIRGLTDISPRRTLTVELYRPSDGRVARFPVICRIDTPTELEYFKNGGVLNYVLRNLARGATA